MGGLLVLRPDGHHAVGSGAGEGGVEGAFGFAGQVKIELLMRISREGGRGLEPGIRQPASGAAGIPW